MTIRLGVVMDPISQIHPYKDSSLAMLLAAQHRGWQLHYMELPDLYLAQGRPMASMRGLRVQDDAVGWYELEAPQVKSLDELDVILMRKDPPVNSEYFYATYILEQAQRDGVLVVNDPAALRDCNEKLFAAQFPECCPPMLVSCNEALLREFADEHGDVVFKPLDLMGGSSIFRVCQGDLNLSVILETLTQGGVRQIMAQRYLPEIRAGDKRVLVIDGEVVPYALARVPAAGEFRGNLAAGGTGECRVLSDRDRWICEQVGPTLKEKGLIFVGVDIIGDYLTEINVTSPTCIRELERGFSVDIAGQLMNCIESKLQAD